MMHQNRIWLTLKLSLSRTFILLLVSTTVSGLGSVLSRHYRYINQHNTWQAAQNYCRSIDDQTDLATIYTKSDADRIDLKNYYAWIGFSRDDNGGIWQPIYGTSIDPSWWGYQSQNDHNCAFVRYDNDTIYGAPCETHLFFICGKPYQVLNQSKTWKEARDYCKNNNGKLAELWSRNDIQSTVKDLDFPVWIGLYRDGQKWTWTAGLSNYTNWAEDEPGNNGNCISISSLRKEMATQNCSTWLPSICYRDNLVLIKENKTWNEALEYCRALRSPTNQKLRYELISIQPEDYDYLKNQLVEANTDEVWTGLRFLAGEWLWVNGADVMHSDLLPCPPIMQHCGAFSRSGTGSMETRDCTVRKNFMCYRKV